MYIAGVASITMVMIVILDMVMVPVCLMATTLLMMLIRM